MPRIEQTKTGRHCLYHKLFQGKKTTTKKTFLTQTSNHHFEKKKNKQTPYISKTIHNKQIQ